MSSWKISGTISQIGTVRITVPVTGALISSTSLPAGAYSIVVPAGGPYDVTAKNTENEILSFANVMAIFN